MSTERRLVVPLPHLSERIGRRVVVEVAEPTIGAFTKGLPDVPPHHPIMAPLDARTSRDLRLEWERWADRMLAEAIVAPTWLKVPEKIERLAADREHLSRAVMDAWGINRKLLWRPQILKMVRRIADRLKTPPTEVLRWPAGDFWTNWYILFSPELDDDEAEAGMRMPEFPNG